MQGEPGQAFTGIAFSRCAHRDGRFKVVGPGNEVIWSDGKKYYRHSEAARYYREIPLDDDFIRSFEWNRSEVYPIYFSRLFNRYSPNALDRGSTRYLQTYKLSSALSTPEHSVFERHDDENHVHSERLWVRNADQSIVRYEGLHRGVIGQVAELTKQEINRPLTDAELSHHVPLLTRFSLLNNPAVFIAGLFVAAAFGAALFWKRLLNRATGLDDVVRTRRLLWKVQSWGLGGVAIIVALLAVLAIIVPGSGHPSGLWVVIVLAMWCAGGFLLTAWFTLMSYPVQWVFERANRGTAQR